MERIEKVLIKDCDYVSMRDEAIKIEKQLIPSFSTVQKELFFKLDSLKSGMEERCMSMVNTVTNSHH